MTRATLRNNIGWSIVWVVGLLVGLCHTGGLVHPVHAQVAAADCEPMVTPIVPVTPIAPISTTHCETAVTPEAFRTFGPSTGQKVQAGLAHIYQGNPSYSTDAQEPSHPLSDGRIGSVTISWVQRFCKDFTFEATPHLPTELLNSLTHFATLAKVPEDWRTTLLSPALVAWMNTQPAMQRSQHYARRRSGQEKPINALLQEFQARHHQPASPPSAPSPPSDAVAITFKLTENAINMVENAFKKPDAKEAIADLKKLQGETYATKKQLEEAAQQALKADPKQASPYVPLLVEQAKKPPEYSLTDAALQKIKVQVPTLPAVLLKALDKVKGLSYPSRIALQEAVQIHLLVLLEQYRVAIAIQAQKETDYALTREVFEALKLKGVPSHVLDHLADLKDTTYPNQQAVQSTLQTRLAALIAQYKTFIAQSFQEKTAYAFTKKSLESVKDQQIPAPLAAKLTELENTMYAERADVAKLAGMLIQGSTEQYVPLIVQASKQKIVFYKLTDNVFAKLKSAQVPEGVIERLQPLKGKSYFSTKAFQNDITKLLEPLLGQYSLYPTALAKAAEQITSYRLTDESLQALKAKGVPPDLVGQLLSLKDIEYASKDEVANVVETTLGPVTAPYNQYPIWAADAADENAHYGLTAPALKALAAQGLPDDMLEPLLQLQDVDYLSRHKFEQAVDVALQPVTLQYHRYPAWIAAEADTSQTYAVTEQAIQELQRAAVPAPTPAPGVAAVPSLTPGKSGDTIGEQLRTLQDIEYINQSLFTQAISITVGPLPPQYMRVIVEAARTEYRKADYSASTVAWSADDCGCGFDDIGTIVYGLYPFWRAEKAPTAAPGASPPPEPTPVAPQKIDFSAFSRIGYYALSFDATGALTAPVHWQPDKAVFINEARKYKTKVDLVITPHWSQFAGLAPSAPFLETVTSNIVNALQQPLNNSTFNRLKPVISLGMSSVPVIGDGITLSVEGTPEDSAIAPFLTFIKMLRTKLHQRRHGAALNLLLPMSALATTPCPTKYLERILPSLESEVNLFLVFLERPSTDAKKTLRSTIEKAFKGDQRREMLRKIVPIITPIGHERDGFKQLEDDLIYFQDNFRGVGFWPLPLATDPGTHAVLQRVKDRLGAEKRQTESDVVELMLFTYAPTLCQFACPHRWLIRLLWDIPFVFLLLYGGVSIWHCGWRAWAQRYFWVFAGLTLVTVLLFELSTMCDPFWSNGTTYMTLLLLVAGIGVTIYQASKKMRQAGAP